MQRVAIEESLIPQRTPCLLVSILKDRQQSLRPILVRSQFTEDYFLSLLSFFKIPEKDNVLQKDTHEKNFNKYFLSPYCL